MRTSRIYQPGQYASGHTLELSPEASLHVGAVLRMKPGEQLILFSGDGREYSASITSVSKKRITVDVLSDCSVNRESPNAIHLAQGVSKGERMSWVVQKAVELGVSSITPLITEHCIVRLDAQRLEKKLAQWRTIAISACEQSGRAMLPMIHKAVTLEAYLGQCHTQLKLVLDPLATQSWRDYDLRKPEAALLIGPEGGFSEGEMKLAQATGFEPMHLGPRILRTETATITALSILQAVAGDL